MPRIIVHLDLDSFYASVETLRHPEIAGKPVVICVYSGRTAHSGAVATANYPARELGIHAGMPIAFAQRKAGPDTVFLPYDKPYYEDVSDRIMELLEPMVDVLEQASIDEAYLDVTQASRGSWDAAARLSHQIKELIRDQEHLTGSIGIGPSKFIAKMAGKQQKPDGLTVVRDDQVAHFIGGIPLEKLHGIGPKTIAVLTTLGIHTVAQLADTDVQKLQQFFGPIQARTLSEKARGIDDLPVQPREKQQLSKIGTLKEDSRDPVFIDARLAELATELQLKIDKKGKPFRTVTLIVVAIPFEGATRSETLAPSMSADVALGAARALLRMYLQEHPESLVRRVGISVSHFEDALSQQRGLGDFLARR